MNEPRPTLQTIFDEMGKSVPLEVGFDKNLMGSREGVTLTSPIPRTNIISEPIPKISANTSLEDVLTRSSIPTVQGMGTQSLITTQVGEPEIRQPEPEVSGEKCTGPGGLCYDEANQMIYNILMSNPVEITCARSVFDYYPMANPVEGDFTWKTDYEFIYRETERDLFIASDSFKLKYSRWSPKGSFDEAPRLLLIHDALDSRKSWWCAQKMMSPFVDTLSVDLLGSGESIKPRGLNSSQLGVNEADVFPWSFKLHAEYLIGMARVVWPKDDFYVAGVGWGAQIAATMASMSNRIKGVVMINPPGFGKDIHPELYYSDIYNLARLLSDNELNNTPVSFIGRVRNILISSVSSSDLGYSGRDTASSAIIRMILDQYTNLDRKRVLIDQLVAISNLQRQEFPKTIENINGLEIEKIMAPCYIVSGGNDIIYPPEHRNLYSAVYYNSQVETRLLPNVGHLAHIEAPRDISETILDFMREKGGFTSLKDAFIGFIGGSQGNEKSLINGFRELYNF